MAYERTDTQQTGSDGRREMGRTTGVRERGGSGRIYPRVLLTIVLLVLFLLLFQHPAFGCPALLLWLFIFCFLSVYRIHTMIPGGKSAGKRADLRFVQLLSPLPLRLLRLLLVNRQHNDVRLGKGGQRVPWDKDMYIDGDHGWMGNEGELVSRIT